MEKDQGHCLLAAKEGGRETLDKVLLHSSSGGDDTVNHLVLDKVAYRLADATRGHVGGVTEKDRALDVLPVLGILQFIVHFVITDRFVAAKDVSDL